MKKSACLMALLGAFAVSSANADSVEITFKGAVSESTCNIMLDNGSTTLNLGTLNKKKVKQVGDHGSMVPLVFQVDGCTSEQSITGVKLVEDLTMDNRDQSDITKGVLSTNQDYVVVKLFKDAAAAPGQEGIELMGGPVKIENHGAAAIKVGYATLAASKTADHMTATTDITAKAMFEVTMQ